MLRKSTQSNHQLLRFLHECHRFGQQIREKAHFGTCLHLLLYDEWQAALSEMLPWLHPWPGRAAPANYSGAAMILQVGTGRDRVP